MFDAVFPVMATKWAKRTGDAKEEENWVREAFFIQVKRNDLLRISFVLCVCVCVFCHLAGIGNRGQHHHHLGNEEAPESNMMGSEGQG